MIDYDRVLQGAASDDSVNAQEYLREELPYVWLDAYMAKLPHKPNVHRVDVDGFEYLWDFSTELVQKGQVAEAAAVADRLIAVHGFSKPIAKPRLDSRLRGRTLGPVDAVEKSQRGQYDRGHAIAHTLGGALDLNIIPQIRHVNRGGLWRRMERYCQQHASTYFFCRPIYSGLSAHPSEIEFGILKADGMLWTSRFRNFERVEELEEFERLYRRKIASDADPENKSEG